MHDHKFLINIDLQLIYPQSDSLDNLCRFLYIYTKKNKAVQIYSGHSVLQSRLCCRQLHWLLIFCSFRYFDLLALYFNPLVVFSFERALTSVNCLYQKPVKKTGSVHFSSQEHAIHSLLFKSFYPFVLKKYKKNFATLLTFCPHLNK